MTEPRQESAIDLLAIGESMVMFTPDPPQPLVDATAVAIHVGGAESNVATYLAELGYRAQWASLVGDDPFGRIILRRLSSAGVDVRSVVTVRGRPTGVYIKDPGDGATSVYYFRHQSAASAMAPAFVSRALEARPRVLHLSGVTAALSQTALDMLTEALALPREGRTTTFDVNYRPGLWRREEAAPVLARLANRSDVAFVGMDEAHSLWGCESPQDVRDVLPSCGKLVVKDGAHGAYSLGAESTTFEASLDVDVVEPVGAGDAFAAGYIAAALEGCGEAERLRMGHLLAAAALTVSSDHGPLPPVAELRRLRGLGVEDWSLLRIEAALDAPFVPMRRGA
jgi:2-dehydro-3-deoxygluconokinase